MLYYPYLTSNIGRAVLLNERIYPEKRAGSWQVSDIEKLVGAEEGVYLEFKKPSEFLKTGTFSRDLVVEELAETVSAFLNSDGGVILFGVQTDKHNTDKKTEFLKPIETWAPNQTFEHYNISLTASQIRDIIYGNIVPKPTGVEVKDIGIPVGEATTTVFVITVAISQLGAHQSVKTLRYYRRTSDGDEPMLDFEIRAVNSRRTGPLLHLSCRVSIAASTPYEDEWKKSSVAMLKAGSERESFYSVDFVIAVSNFGRGTANTARFDVGIPDPWYVMRYSPDGTNVGAHWESNSGLQYSVASRVTVFWTPDKCLEIPQPNRNKRLSEQIVAWQQVIYSGNQPPAHPIWPNLGRKVIGVLRLRRNINGVNVPPFLWLPWRAFSDDMLETRGAALVIERANEFYAFNYEMDEVCWWHQAEDEQKFEELKQRFQVI
jgi:hypothetical protein